MANFDVKTGYRVTSLIRIRDFENGWVFLKNTIEFRARRCNAREIKKPSEKRVVSFQNIKKLLEKHLSLKNIFSPRFKKCCGNDRLLVVIYHLYLLRTAESMLTQIRTHCSRCSPNPLWPSTHVSESRFLNQHTQTLAVGAALDVIIPPTLGQAHTYLRRCLSIKARRHMRSERSSIEFKKRPAPTSVGVRS